MSMELTGMTRSSLRPPSTTFPISLRVSSNETASTASLISSLWLKAPHARKLSSARLRSRPLMLTIVHPPFSENKTFLFILQVWGGFRSSGLLRPHALIAHFKNPACHRYRGCLGFVRGFSERSETGRNDGRPDSLPSRKPNHCPTPSSPFGAP